MRDRVNLGRVGRWAWVALGISLFHVAKAAPPPVYLDIQPDQSNRLAVIAYNSTAAPYRVEVFAPSRSAVELVPPKSSTVLGWFNAGAEIYPEDLSFRYFVGDFNARPNPTVEYMMPLDRVPDREQGIYVFNRSPSGIPVRVARSGVVVEVRLDPFDRWHVLIEHDDKTIGRYRPLSCDLKSPPRVGQTFNAGTVLCRTTPRTFTFAALQPTRSLSSEKAAFEVFEVKWAKPVSAKNNQEEGKAKKQEIAGTKAEEATGKVSQVGKDAVAPPPPAEKVAQVEHKKPEALPKEEESSGSGYDWPLLIGIFVGFFGVLGGLGGYAWVAQRKEAARLAELMRHREELARQQAEEAARA